MSQKEVQIQKEVNLVQELLPKVVTIKKEIEQVERAVIFAQIAPVGRPQIIIDTAEPIKAKFWQSKKKIRKAIHDRMVKAINRFYSECNKIGVVPYAEITPNGAEVKIGLTEAKRKELNPVIIPVNKPKIIIPFEGK